MNQVAASKQNLKCDNHSDKQALVMRYDQNGFSQFQCFKCYDKDSSQRLYIYLEDLIDQKDEEIIENWPPLNNQKIFEQIQNIRNKKLLNNELQNYIQQFEQIENKIIQKLAEYKKNFINRYECLSGDQVMQKWNEISEIKKFKEFFSKPDIDRSSLKLFLQEQISKVQSNTQIIQNEIKFYETQKPQNLDQLNITYKNINYLLDNLLDNQQIIRIEEILKNKQILLSNKNYLENLIQQIINDYNQTSQIKQQFTVETIDQLSFIYIKGQNFLNIYKTKSFLIFTKGLDLSTLNNKQIQEVESHIQSSKLKGWWIAISFDEQQQQQYQQQQEAYIFNDMKGSFSNDFSKFKFNKQKYNLNNRVDIFQKIITLKNLIQSKNFFI